MATDLHIEPSHLRPLRSRRGLEVEVQRLLQISQSLLFGSPLAGNVYLEALRDEPMVFSRDARSKPSLQCTGSHPWLTGLTYTSNDISSSENSTSPA